jgi:8-oxo-dGTP pyrophosphatase MutT (NUDIX family)
MPRSPAAIEGTASEASGMESVGEPPKKRGVIAITRREEKFLVIRRGLTVAAGGTICFPGGHIEPGEEEHEAVVRECREELAATVEPAECIWRSVSPWGTPLAWWTVRLVEAGELVPHPIEVAEILWLSVEEMLADPTLLEGNRPFLEAIREGRVAV